MPVEIREIIIKTEIRTSRRHQTDVVKEKELNVFKKLLIDECKRMVAESTKKISNKR